MQRGQLNGAANAIVSGTLTFAQAWGLDATGNWGQFWENDTGASWDLQQSRLANQVNEITSISGGGWPQPAYDAAGNMTAFPQPASPSTADEAIYDAWNRMTQVWSGGSLVQPNVFDGLGRRVSKLVGSALRHYYFSARWQSLEERLGPSTSPDRQFVWGLRYIDNLILRDCSDFTPSRLYPFHDPNWNVTAICSSSGTVSERYDYAPYGEPTFLSTAFAVIGASVYGWETLFAGYRWDSDSRLYCVRARYFDAMLGRFLSRDPLGPLGASPHANGGRHARGLNPYEYADAQPLTLTDPSGEDPCAAPDPRLKPTDWGGWVTGAPGEISYGNCWLYATCTPMHGCTAPLDGSERARFDQRFHFRYPPGHRHQGDPLDCISLKAAVRRAGGVRPKGGDGSCPPCSYKIYLVISDDRKLFHVCRQEPFGGWTQKWGTLPPTNVVDPFGEPVGAPDQVDLTDPVTKTPYTVKCGYMCWPYDKIAPLNL
jgi:RHS repeat-associated protein